MQDETTTLIQTTKIIAPGPSDRKTKYTLTLETANEDSATGFDKLTECSITLQTLQSGRFKTVELQVADQASIIGYLDPHESHTFYCGPQPGQDFNPRSLTYEMSIESLTEDDENPTKPLID